MKKIFLLVFLFVFPITALAYSYSGEKWFRFPGTVLTVDIDPNGRNIAENAAIRNAMQSWSDAGANFYYVDTVTSGNDFGYYYDANTVDLAYTYRDYNWLGYIKGIHIRINTAKPWATNGDSNSYDFESMVAHELGHGLRLLHSSGTEATMYGSMPRGETKKRSLDVDDENGIKYIYGSI